MRIMIASYLTPTTKDWIKFFTFINTGTYNSQWMILDFNKFDKSNFFKKKMDQENNFFKY